MLVISYVGHATLLIEIAGVRVLTDPNFDARLGGVLRRVAAPVPSLAALDQPDAILVSHAHADHLSPASIFSLAAFRQEPAVPVYAPPALARALRRALGRARQEKGERRKETERTAPRPLESSKADSREFTKGDEEDTRVFAATPVQLERGRTKGAGMTNDSEPHFEIRAASPPEGSLGSAVRLYVGAAAHEGSRYGFDRWGGRGDANTYLIDSGTESVFFAGDTGLRENSHELVARILGPARRRLDVALLPIGYAPWWKPGFRRNHLSPADALTLFDRLDARVLIPYHWGTFHHFSSGPFDAVRQLEEALADYPRRTDVRVSPPGSRLVIEPPADGSVHSATDAADRGASDGAGS
jgi:L-ascorbate metabolism protein UlaG (beta-lactamase superfamily)